jgi:hypothetical protein
LNREFLATHPAFKGFHDRMAQGLMDPYSAAALAMTKLLEQENPK